MIEQVELAVVSATGISRYCNYKVLVTLILVYQKTCRRLLVDVGARCSAAEVAVQLVVANVLVLRDAADPCNDVVQLLEVHLIATLKRGVID